MTTLASNHHQVVLLLQESHCFTFHPWKRRIMLQLTPFSQNLKVSVSVGLYPASRGPSIFLDIKVGKRKGPLPAASTFPVEHALNSNLTEPCRPRYN